MERELMSLCFVRDASFIRGFVPGAEQLRHKTGTGTGVML